MIGDLLLKGRLFNVRLHFEVYSDLNRHIGIIFLYKLPYDKICIYMAFEITRFVYVLIVDKKTVSSLVHSSPCVLSAELTQHSRYQTYKS